MSIDKSKDRQTLEVVADSMDVIMRQRVRKCKLEPRCITRIVHNDYSTSVVV